MFLGTVPNAFVQQMLAVVDFENWERVHVCCSGTFKVDRVLRKRFPDLKIYSNDVSLYSTALGRLFTGAELEFEFTERLGFIEAILHGEPYINRVAALLVALEMSRFKSKHPYYQRHFRYYEQRFEQYLEAGVGKLSKSMEPGLLTGYFAGDWLIHIDRAIKSGSGIVAFPPFYKGGYEAQFRFIDQNTKWSPPPYLVYDPERFHDVLTKVDRSGVPYCLHSDQVVDGFKPVIEHRTMKNVPHFGYARTARGSVRRFTRNTSPIAYSPIDLYKVNRRSTVRIGEVPHEVTDYVRDVYLSADIVQRRGNLNFVILIDEMLVGCLVYNWNRYAWNSIYLMSDVTLPGGFKLSKFVTRLSICREVISMVEARMLHRIETITTTAISRHPMSMKYRGIYDLKVRKQDEDTGKNIITYSAPVREESGQQVFNWWYRKYLRGKNRLPD